MAGVSWLDPNDIETLVAALAAGTSWSDAKDLLPADKVDGTHLDTWETALTAKAAQRASEFCPGAEAREAVYAALVTPTFTSITPATGDPGGSERVVIVGTGFQPGATVTIGGHAQTVLSVNPTTIVIKTVAHAAAAAANVVITNPDTTTVTEAAAFTFSAVDDPTFTSITPSAGTAKGGTVCRIVGTKFREGVTVKFGTKKAYVQARTGSTVLFVVTPPNAAGATDIVITNLNAETVTATEAFTYA